MRARSESSQMFWFSFNYIIISLPPLQLLIAIKIKVSLFQIRGIYQFNMWLLVSPKLESVFTLYGRGTRGPPTSGCVDQSAALKLDYTAERQREAPSQARASLVWRRPSAARAVTFSCLFKVESARRWPLLKEGGVAAPLPPSPSPPTTRSIQFGVRKMDGFLPKDTEFMSLERIFFFP